MADGCHRLAYLLLHGRGTLEPAEFEVHAYERFTPFDSTSLLVPVVRPTEADYVDYLARGYGAPTSLTTVDGLLAHLRATRPDLVEEVVGVLHVDGFPWPTAR